MATRNNVHLVEYSSKAMQETENRQGELLTLRHVESCELLDEYMDEHIDEAEGSSLCKI